MPASGRIYPFGELSGNARDLREADGWSRRIVFSNEFKGGRLLRVSTLSGACVLCVLVRHLMG